LAMALGKEGLQPRHLRFGQPEKVAHRSVSSQSLNHAESGRSMGPDPSVPRRSEFPSKNATITGTTLFKTKRDASTSRNENDRLLRMLCKASQNFEPFTPTMAPNEIKPISTTESKKAIEDRKSRNVKKTMQNNAARQITIIKTSKEDRSNRVYLCVRNLFTFENGFPRLSPLFLSIQRVINGVAKKLTRKNAAVPIKNTVREKQALNTNLESTNPLMPNPKFEVRPNK
ncbi:hypothetical protein, partial [Tabrizicola sp.]|uniref:hypothetical protein n=1 Tax=Tabrizicola sp. TaxID=2005166 RepID=UPI0025E594F2